MRLLLDTHALLWWLLDDPRLSARVRVAIADGANEVMVSSVSAFEIATKHRLGKLWTGKTTPVKLFDLVAEQQFSELALTIEHAVVAGALPAVHRDPFDRLLSAQSIVEGVPVVTTDPAFERLGTEAFW